MAVSHHIPILEIKDISRYFNFDTGMLTRLPVPIYKIISRFNISRDVPSKTGSLLNKIKIMIIRK